MTDPAAKTSALSAEEEAELRALAPYNIAVPDQRRIWATLDAARTDYEARITALEGALLKYGDHKYRCAVKDDYSPCNCGYAEAIAPVIDAVRALLATPPTAADNGDAGSELGSTTRKGLTPASDASDGLEPRDAPSASTPPTAVEPE